MNRMVESKEVGPALIVSILRDAKKPLTKELSRVVHRLVPHCMSDNVVILNLMRIRGTIKGKRTENGSWIWWIEGKEESK
jgi:hypothetical protein